MVTLLKTLSDHTDDINCCDISFSYLASCSLDKTIRVYSLNDFSELPYSPLRGHTYAVHCCCFSPSGKLLASCSTDGSTILWNTESGEILAVLEHPGSSPVRVCKFSPDSTCIASGAADGTVALWNSDTRKLIRSGKVSDGSLSACAFSPDGNIFVIGSSCGNLTVWDHQMKCLQNVKAAHDLGVTCCDFSSALVLDDMYTSYFHMVSCGQDNKIKFWSMLNSEYSGYSLKFKYVLNVHTAPVLSCAFSSDGRFLLSGSVDKSVLLFEVSSGNVLHTLTQHTRYVTTCAFSPLLHLFATGSMDKTLNVWQIGEESPGIGAKLTKRSNLSIKDWSEKEVSDWLSAERLEDLVEIFMKNNIDGKELLDITKESLQKELKVESLGLRNKVLRKIEELRSQLPSEQSGIPDEFLCPITREPMKDPVIASDGYSYERLAITDWIGTRKRTSPMTNLPLTSCLLTPNRTLKMAIDRWQESQQTK
ncbi:WD repeat, SAM and U-box domain-containing protein 1 [Protopterus annectens]|uniref:WD repeat, SAM and U-box domain-containing protein 1 n=1 Tax=Protopterus annectens TaxID=7888 RepID=UPI001CFB5F7F|nr:WD repeat, SAM and U-box domain-containing protein 1 [Protopterus annectens]